MGQIMYSDLTTPRAAFMAAFALLVSVSSATAQSSNERTGRNVPAAQKIILITGSTDGLGREVARRLAAGGAHVIVHGRNRERGAAVVQEIEREGKGSAAFYPADLASLAEVRQLAETIQRDYDRIDVIINNAGIWLNRSTSRELSADGHEMHFAVNYLSHFLLTRLLLPRLPDGARIVNVASAAQAPLDFDNLMLDSGYNGSRAYALSKLAQVMFSFDLARELKSRNIIVSALHPATLMDTPMVSEAGVPARSTVAEGADAVINLVTAPDLETGQYFNGRQPGRALPQAYDEAVRDRLRLLSMRLANLLP
jgi:NAD(P)-dependent dehydrogenase (short-subunit alcohol dehydrogenase family)